MQPDFERHADEIRRSLNEDSRSPAWAFEPFEPFEPPDTANLPSFPVDCLPPVLRYMATAAADNLQVSVDMAAVSALTVASLCTQGKFIINPKPGWVEPLNLYAAVIARPSDRKTPALDLTSVSHLEEFDIGKLPPKLK